MVRYRQTTPTSVPLPGTKVGVRYGGRIVAGVVTEDRGVLAGHQVVRVHVGEWEDSDAPEFEVPVDELQPVPAAA